MNTWKIHHQGDRKWHHRPPRERCGRSKSRIALEILSNSPQKISADQRESASRLIAKSKSMVTEEIELNHALEAAGHRVVETDLGEYIIQLRGERPSHIITPPRTCAVTKWANSFTKNSASPTPKTSPP
jgi:hypothetical protein